MLSYDEAVEFCRKATELMRAAKHIEKNQVIRLPTEAEWEYACRAGTTTDFPYGNDPSYVRLQAYAWYNANSSGRTQPVGSKVPNQWGLFDMMGNVWEWCLDYFNYLPTGNFTDPPGPDRPYYGGTNQRVVRGGGYGDGAVPGGSLGPYTLLFARWYGGGPAPDVSNDRGFRVVLAPAP
jgi:formylglycine-generating enzyme required for sulfatase activity